MTKPRSINIPRILLTVLIIVLTAYFAKIFFYDPPYDPDKHLAELSTKSLLRRASWQVGGSTRYTAALDQRGESAIPDLTAALSTPDSKLEQLYGRFISALPKKLAIHLPPPAIPAGIRMAAASQLANFGPKGKAAVPELINQFPRRFLGPYVLDQLLKIGPGAAEAKPFLISLLTNSNPVIRVKAAEVIEKIAPGDPLVKGVLMAHLNSTDSLARIEAASALVGDTNSTQSVLRAVNDAITNSNPMVFQEAASLILNMDVAARAEAIPALIAGLKSASPWVHHRTAYVLGTLGPRAHSAVPGLLAIIPEQFAGSYAIAALRKIGGATTGELSDVITALRSSNPAVRLMAAESIASARCDIKLAFTALAEAMNDKDWHVRAKATEAIRSAAPDAETAVQLLSERLNDPNAVVKFHAVAALRHLGPKSIPALPGLLAAFSSSDAATRESAARAVAAMGADGDAARPELLAMLNHAAAEDRRLAIIALTGISIQDKSAIPRVLEMAKDPDAGVRNEVRGALKELSDETPADK